MAASLKLLERQPVEPYYFGYNLESYATCGVNLTFNDSGGLALAQALHLGVLRYPGGTGSNIWDMKKGRYLPPPTPQAKGYDKWTKWKPVVDSFPEGTFSASAFLQGLGGSAAKTIWCLNVYSLNASETCEQVHYISQLPGQQEPGVLLELGNELYLTSQGLPRFPDAGSYALQMQPVVACARKLMPRAKVAAAGWIGNGSEATAAWNRGLRPYASIFDGVSQHGYAPTHLEIKDVPESQRVTFVAGYSRAVARQEVRMLRAQVGRADMPVWQTEFGFGLDNASQCVVRDYMFGALHGAFHAARILSAINEPGTFGAITMETFVFPLPDDEKSRSDDWCGMPAGRLRPADPNRPDEARVSGTGQLVSHLAARALAATAMHAVRVTDSPMAPLPILGEDQPCVQAAAFSQADGSVALALLNICNQTVPCDLGDINGGSGGHRQAVSASVYSLLDAGTGGGWAALPADPSALPWAAPLRPKQLTPSEDDAASSSDVLAEPLSFAIFELPPPQAVATPTAAAFPPGAPASCTPPACLRPACTNATDCADELQAAISSGAETVLVGLLPGARPWTVGRTLHLASNQRLLLEAGVEIHAKRGAFRSPTEVLVSANGVTNVTIEGGANATLRMRRADYANGTAGLVYRKGEWRHGISLTGVRRVRIAGVRVTESGGDGVYIARSSSLNYSSEVIVEDVRSDRNYRQGLSVISAVNVTVRRSVLAETGVGFGTPPMCGIDFEPNLPSDQLHNVTVEDVQIVDNVGGGVAVYLRRFSEPCAGATGGVCFSAPSPVAIHFRNLVVDGTPNTGVAVGAMAPLAHGPAGAGGSISFAGGAVRNTGGAGLYAFDLATSVGLEVEGTRFERTAQNSSLNATPLYMGSLHGKPTGYAVGGLALANVSIAMGPYCHSQPFLTMANQPSGFVDGGVSGEADVEVAAACSAPERSAECAVPEIARGHLRVDCRAVAY
jgi:hypothetical protein